MRKKVLRLLRSLPLALLFVATVASAQTTGTIIGVVTDASTGKPVAGALVVATSPNMQGEQTAVTDSTGSFRLTLLPPGAFKLAVQLEGYKPGERTDINLRVDKTLRANLTLVPEAVQMEEQVVRTGVAPVINIGTAETGTVVTKEFIGSVPVGRDFATTAIVAPGVQRDGLGITFYGASSPEAGYILDGLNVSDPAYGTQGSRLLSNFAEEIDVKTGAYMPEYGRSTSGVVAMVTKSGSNEFHGSIFGNYSPGFLRPGANTVQTNASAVTVDNQISKGFSLDLGGEVGGPILKDKLWFYAGIAPTFDKISYDRYLQKLTEDPNAPGKALVGANGLTQGTKLAATDKYYDDLTTRYQLLGKLTYLIDENNNVSGSLAFVPTSRQGYTPAPGTDSANIFYTSGNAIDGGLRYAGKFLNKHLIVEAAGGIHSQKNTPDPRTVDGIDQRNTAAVQWIPTHNLGDFETVPADCNPTATFSPCPVSRYVTGGYGFLNDNTLNRMSGRLSLSGLFEAAGHHAAKGGLDLEQTYYDATRAYSGGQFIRETVSSSYGTVYQWYRNFGTVDNNKPYSDTNPDIFVNKHVKSISNSYAFYLQDSWSVMDLVTLNAGVRWEIQDMRAGDNSPKAFNIKDNIAPRVQAIYDFTGQGRSKISASWGRFYEAIPLDMGDRSFGAETQVRAIAEHCVSASPTVGGTPATCPVIPGGTFDPQTNTLRTYGLYGGAANTVPVDPNVKGQYVDQFGGTIEYEVLPDMSVGFTYMGTRLGRVIEDMSSDDGTTFFIANPGEGKPFTVTNPDGTTTVVNPKTVTTVDPITLRKYNIDMPLPERKYDGFTFELRKNLSKNWLASASYTYSSFRGNYPGLIAYGYGGGVGQLDPNITAEYDLVSLLPNRYGPLFNDNPHQIKLFGAYNYDISSRLKVTGGGSISARSGNPINITGAHFEYGPGLAYIFPRGYGGRMPMITQVDIKGALEYVISAPYTLRFSIDVFNLFNSQPATAVDQNYTFDAVLPIANGVCKSKNGAEGNNPIAGVQSDCPDINYLRTTDGRPVTVNKNFGRATSYLAPLQMRFGLTFTF